MLLIGSLLATNGNEANCKEINPMYWLLANSSESARLLALARKLGMPPADLLARASSVGIKVENLLPMLEAWELIKALSSTAPAQEIAKLRGLMLSASSVRIEAPRTFSVWLNLAGASSDAMLIEKYFLGRLSKSAVLAQVPKERHQKLQAFFAITEALTADFREQDGSLDHATLRLQLNRLRQTDTFSLLPLPVIEFLKRELRLLRYALVETRMSGNDLKQLAQWDQLLASRQLHLIAQSTALSEMAQQTNRLTIQSLNLEQTLLFLGHLQNAMNSGGAGYESYYSAHLVAQRHRLALQAVGINSATVKKFSTNELLMLKEDLLVVIKADQASGSSPRPEYHQALRVVHERLRTLRLD
jgi:hypothetical protein